MPTPRLTQEQLLTLWRRLFPATYAVPFEEDSGGQGFDIVAAHAAIWARVAEAIDVTTQAGYLRAHSEQTAPPASGGAKATGSVEISRVPPLAGDIVLTQGTELVVVQRNETGEEVEGAIFELVDDVTLSAGDLGPVSAPIVSTRDGYQGNVPPNRITQFVLRGRSQIVGASVLSVNTLQDTGVPDRFTQGQVGQYVEFVSGTNAGSVRRRIIGVTQGTQSIATLDGPDLAMPDTVATVNVVEFADLGLTVTQPVATSGGRNAFLDAIGRDRGTGRVGGESDEPYRLRIGTLPDVVSPAALNRIAARILSPFGIAYRIMETRDPLGLFGLVWDKSAYDHGSIATGDVTLGATCGVTRFFVILVAVPTSGGFATYYDATTTPRPNAWDVSHADGTPVAYNRAIATLHRAIRPAKAGGVCYKIIQDASL